jgi:hypothetical protein
MSHQNQPNKDQIATILKALAEAPDSSDVSTSFSRTMMAVTDHKERRILTTAHSESETPRISPFLMQLHTKYSLVAGTLVVVLLVGYMSYNRVGPYEDLELAAIEDQSEYELSTPEDDFSDVAEDPITSPEDTPAATAPAPAGATAPVEQPLVTNTGVDVSTELATFDSLFSSDDIDDSALESWVTDTSASDVLTESYDI